MFQYMTVSTYGVHIETDYLRILRKRLKVKEKVISVNLVDTIYCIRRMEYKE